MKIRYVALAGLMVTLGTSGAFAQTAAAPAKGASAAKAAPVVAPAAKGKKK